MWQFVRPLPFLGTVPRLFLTITMTNEQTKKLLDEYKNDPVSFRLKYGATAESELLETAHKKGMTKEVKKQTAKYGGKMKKGYKEGRTVSDNDKEMQMAYDLAKAEMASGGGKDISDQDFENALRRVKKIKSDKTGKIKKILEGYIARGRGTGSPHTEMQQGGIADMSAAPMVRPRKKKTQSGFRSKYSKGGGVRPAKYKI